MTKQEKAAEVAERDDRIRAASLKGETPASIAAAEGVSVATVRRSLKASTSASLDSAEAAGKRARADRAEQSKTERKLAAVPDAEGDEPKAKAEPKPRSTGQRTKVDLAAAQAFGGDKWSDEDRAVIAREYERVGGTSVWRPASGVYLRIEDQGGKLVMAVEKARLRFPAKAGNAPKGAVEKKDGFADLALGNARTAAATA
jgi:hypothetical protein